VTAQDPGRWPRGELEGLVLGTLCKHREATARELFESVVKSREVVYTTVAKVLDRLVDKGFVSRHRVGRVYRYSPLVERAAAQRSLADAFVRQLVGGDPQPAVAALIGAMEKASPELLERLAAELATRKRDR
jgi:BlaI family penicillinase repressor